MITEAVQHQAAGSIEKPLPDIADTIINELPVEMGYKPIAEIPVPQFSLGTVFWGLSQMRGL
jgi:hypothetical protein